MEIWVVTVNYKNTKPTESLVRSIEKCNNSEFVKIAIADNASTIETLDNLSHLKEVSENEITLIPFNENKFYWPASKLSFEKLKSTNNKYPDWLLICNNDIIFSDKDFFTKILNFDKDQFPIIGPNIINRKKEKLNPFMIKPLGYIEHIYWWLYFLSYPTSVVLNKIKNLVQNKKKNFFYEKINKHYPVYAVHGSAILFSSAFFKMGGWFDDNFEMYGEELTVAEIAEKLNIPITYFPEITILHHEHSTTNMEDKKLLFEKAKDSHKYVISNYIK